MTVIQFPGHKIHKSCSAPACPICEGGLEFCETCGGFEGSMTTDCPGSVVSTFLADEVYRGEIDYRRGHGWVRGAAKWLQAMGRPKWKWMK